MALINCKECNKEISSEASSCPNCGASNSKGYGYLVLVIILAVFIWLYFSIDSRARVPLSQTDKISTNDECTIDKIKVIDLKTKFESQCASNKCISLTGTLTLENNCNEPIGVQVKVTSFDKNNNPIQVRELWPASIRNINVGQEIFSVDHYVDYNEQIESVSVQPISLNKWK